MTTMIQLTRIMLMLVFAVCGSRCSAQKNTTGDLKNFPLEASPARVGKKLVLRYLELPYQNFNRPTPPKYITYPETCAWYGALNFAKLTNDTQLKQNLVERFDPLFDSRDSLLPKPEHVDYTVFGCVPFELYMQTKDQKYLSIAKTYADKQWEAPDSLHATANALNYYNRGFSWQTRMWIDDMFMITALQTQAFRATGEEKYINRAARQMVLYLDSLQKQNGLFYHAPDVPFFWGRGNGWFAAGMSELLRSLPENNKDRPRIMQGYKTMMASLLEYQADDGMWRQLIDDPSSWKETSCTGMFAFAFITGVKEGWLDAKTYGPAARKAWLSLITYINKEGDITDVCEGTNKKNDRQYYLWRKRNVGDLHGQAPVLWCANALLR